MLGCLSIGVSGLSANNSEMSVIANNIANANTPAYKSQRANFADILAQQSGGLEIGGGVSIGSVSSVLSQGSLNASENVTDMAIDGSGFFIVKDDSGVYYTRAGQFHMDNDGKLVTPKGLTVQGWDIKDGLGLTSPPSDINISNIAVPPRATDKILMEVKLKSNDTVMDDDFNPANPSKTANYASSVSVYDASGNVHDVTIYFRKLDTQDQWRWYAFDGGQELAGQRGDLIFDGVNLTSDSQTPGTITMNGQEIKIDFTGSSQSAESFSTLSLSQTGYGEGSLQRISITKDGVIQGVLSNGRYQDIALISLADFSHPDGLMQMGDNLYQFTPESGQPIINPPGVGGKGKIMAYNLEGSNVDLAAEFVKMIVTQRAFQANARTITTADQMLTELVNLKR